MHLALTEISAERFRRILWSEYFVALRFDRPRSDFAGYHLAVTSGLTLHQMVKVFPPFQIENQCGEELAVAMMQSSHQ